MAHLLKTGTLSRRTMLRGMGGVTIALPWLEAMAAAKTPAASPMRMVCVGTYLGFVPDQFFPADAGAGYTAPSLLQPLQHVRKDFTVFSGLDHGVNAVGGHEGTHAFLSGITLHNSSALETRNITMDQVAASRTAGATRYASLQLSPETQDSWKMSWTSSGVGIAPIESLPLLFNLLFQQDDLTNISARRAQMAEQRSVLDTVLAEANALQGKLGSVDRARLDHYFTSIRTLEERLVQSEAWLEIPKPSTQYRLPSEADSLDYVKRVPLFYQLMALALQTDATRIITLELSDIGPNSGGLGVTRGYHTLSHHGKVQNMLDELHRIEIFNMKTFGDFLSQLKEVTEPDGKTLLDRTMTLMGSGLGNASSHSNKNIPLLLAGGGFRHGQHLAKAGKDGTSLPANNLYLSMLQRFGLEMEEFNMSTGTLTGLEVA